jgi:hypothetical protein
MDQVLDSLGEPRKLDRVGVLTRAVLLLSYLDAEIESGKELLVRDRQTGEATKINLDSEPFTQIMRANGLTHLDEL